MTYKQIYAEQLWSSNIFLKPMAGKCAVVVLVPLGCPMTLK